MNNEFIDQLSKLDSTKESKQVISTFIDNQMNTMKNEYEDLSPIYNHLKDQLIFHNLSHSEFLPYSYIFGLNNFKLS